MQERIENAQGAAIPESGAAMDRKRVRALPRWVPYALATVCLIVLMSLGFLWLHSFSGARLSVDTQRVSISTVRQGVFEDFIPVRGRVTPRSTVVIDAVEGGRVEEVLVEDGALVEAGQILARLSNPSLRLQTIAREAEVSEQLYNLNALELDLERNRLDHERRLVEIEFNIARLTRESQRQGELLERGHTPVRQVEIVGDELTYWTRLRDVTIDARDTDFAYQTAQLEQLRASTSHLENNLALARASLDALIVQAPVAGQLTSFSIEVGQSLGRNERIAQIDDPEAFKLTVLIDEFYLSRVDEGQVGEIVLDGDRYRLAISKIYPQVRNGEFEVDMVFSQAAPDQIRRGQTLQVRLSLGDPSQSLLIPNGAFYQDTGGEWVFVVAPDGGFAVRRPVELGRRNARYIEVLAGLEADERVITSPYTAYLNAERVDLLD